MNKGLYFILGVVAGASGMYLYLTRKNKEEEKNEQIEEPVVDGTAEEVTEEPVNNDDEDTWVYHKIPVTESGNKIIPDHIIKTYKEYRGEVNMEPVRKGDVEGAYYITEDEFGTEFDYDNNSFTCYADGIVTDETDEIIEPGEYLPEDFMDRFEDEDVLYLRDDGKKCDYEVVKDLRLYSEVPRPKRGVINDWSDFE
jgi:hypothetical protein